MMELSISPAEYKYHAILSRFRPRPVAKTKAIIPPLGLIYECAAEACGTTVEKCQAGDRKRYNVQARMIAANYIASNTRMSLAAIGQYFSGRDHATVLHMRRNYANLMEINDDEVVRATETFLELLKEQNENYSMKNDLYVK